MGKSAKDMFGLVRTIRGAIFKPRDPVIPAPLPPTQKDYIHQAREAITRQGPSWWSRFLNPDISTHYRASMDTFDTVTDPAKFKALRDQAKENLQRWKSEPSPEGSHEVEVTQNDWSIDALKLAKQTGDKPAVLTNGSAEIPGGAFPLGTAQEELLFTTTTAPRYLQHAFNPNGDSRLHFDPTQGVFRYTPEERQLIIGATLMTPEELKKLSKARQTPVHEAFKVYIHNRPLICFKGPDVRYAVDDPHAYPQALKSGYIIDPKDSYKLLPKEDIFPFTDLVAAAPNLADGGITLPRHKGGRDIPTDWADPVFLQAYDEDMGRRVGAMLDTLAVQGSRTVVIPPIGCGAYKNDPHHVARIFRDKIFERPNCFDHIVFSVRTGPGLEEANFKTFEETLAGTPLHRDGIQHSFHSPGKRAAGTSAVIEEKDILDVGFTKKA